MRFTLLLAVVAIGIASCSSHEDARSPDAAPNGPCREPTLDVPCSSASCPPLRVTSLAGTCVESGVGPLTLRYGFAGPDGTSILLPHRIGSGSLIDVVVLDRDGRERTEDVLTENWFGLTVQSVPLIFGSKKVAPDDSAQTSMMARRQGDGWTTEPIRFPGDDSGPTGQILEAGGHILGGAIAGGDGTIYATLVTTLYPDGAILTKRPMGPWTVMTEPTLPPSGVSLLYASDIFVESSGKLGLVYGKCPAAWNSTEPCTWMTRVYGDPSSERTLASQDGAGLISGYGASTFAADPDRWFFLVGEPLPSHRSRLRTIADQGTSEVEFPSRSYPGLVTNCDNTQNYPNTCPGRCHEVGNDITRDFRLDVTSDGVPWLLYVEIDVDEVTSGGGAILGGAGGGMTVACPFERSGHVQEWLVLSRLDGGHETIRGRWTLPEDMRFGDRSFYLTHQGTELQAELSESQGQGSLGSYRFSIDTNGTN